jgi:hypothetical protein
MKWAFDNSTKLVALLSLVLIVIATVHDWGYFYVIGPKFRSIQTTYDYITSVIEWLPALTVFAIFLVASSFLMSRSRIFETLLWGGAPGNAGFDDHQRISAQRRRRTYVMRVFIPNTILIGLFGLLLPFPAYLGIIATVISVSLVAGTAIFLEEQFPASKRLVGAVSLIPFFFCVGIVDGYWATITPADVHGLKLKGGEIRHASVLRTFEKGVLTWNPSTETVQFIRWDQIDELDHFVRHDNEVLAWCANHLTGR